MTDKPHKRPSDSNISNPENEATVGLSSLDEAKLKDTQGTSISNAGETSKRKQPQIEGYEIIDVLGRGGMGVVYKARDLRLKRTVALKMILTGEHAGEEHLRRFRSEAETIARLHHSNIVQIYDVREQDGQPFLSLEFVDGVDLATFSAGSPQPTRLAAELLEAMAHAIHYAHQQGVVHRDLKPGNVLLGKGIQPPPIETKSGVKNAMEMETGTSETRNDRLVTSHLDSSSQSSSGPTSLHSQSSLGSKTRAPSSISNVDGQLATSTGLIPKITDFGLAKQLDSEAEFTSTGQILGTALYMAPEQADGSNEIGSWTDIYALGAILYKLLTGHPPFQGTTLLETLQMVQSTEPVPPTRFQPRLSKDLETICLKCLQKDPTRRYVTAGDLADELRRFLKDEPILARPVSRLEKLRRLCRRNPVVAALISTCAALFVVGFLLVSWKWREAADAHQVITQQLVQLNQAVSNAVTAEALAGRQRDLSLQREAELTVQEGLRLAERGEVSRGCLWMVRSLQILNEIRNRESLDPALAKKNANWEKMIRINISAWIQWCPEIIQAHAPDVSLAPDSFMRGLRIITRGAISPDGSSYVLSDAAGRVSHFDTDTGRRLAMAIPIQLDSSAVSLDVAPDGSAVAIGLSRDAINATNPNYEAEPTRVLIFDLPTGKQIGVGLQHQDHVMQVRFSPDGSVLLTESERHVRSWKVATGRLLHELTLDENVRGVEFSPAGDLFLVRTNGSEAVYATRSFEPIDPATTTRTGRPLAFHPDGQSVLIASEYSQENGSILQLHDLSGRRRQVRIRNYFGFETQHRDDWAFTPDGQTLLGICGDDSMRLWDVATGRLAGAPIRFSKWNEPFEASADGQFVITEKWLIRTPRPHSRPSLALEQAAVEGTPNLDFPSGRGPSTVAYPARFDLKNRRSRAVLTRPYGFRNPTSVTALKDALDGQPLGPPLPHLGNHIRAVAISPDGSLAATANHVQTIVGGAVNIWNTETGERIWGPLPHTNWVPVLAFSPDSRLLAAGDYHGLVRFWDTRSGIEAREPLQHQEIVFSLAFDSTGTKLAVGTTSDRNNSPHCRVWEVGSGRPLSPRLEHGDWVHWVQFSPDGRRLLTATDRGTRLWDTATYEQIGELVPTEKPLLHIAWKPDGTMFSSCTEEGKICLHNGDSGQVTGTMSHPRAIHCMAFSVDGSILATGAEDGSTRLWDVATHQPIGSPLVQASAIHRVAFATDERHLISTARDGTTRIWPIPQPTDGTTEHIAQRIELWTGMCWLDGNSLSNLTPEEWQRRKSVYESQSLQQGSPAAAQSVTDWHRARAADGEQDRNGFAAAWHLARLIERGVDTWTLRVRLARALMWQGNYSAASQATPTPNSPEQFTGLQNWLLHDLANEEIHGQEEHVDFLEKQLEKLSRASVNGQ